MCDKLKLTYLVVDDESFERKQMCDSLVAKCKISQEAIMTAGSYQEVEKIIKDTSISLAIVDYHLGEKDGIDVIRLIKQKYKSCICILWTAKHLDEQHKEKAYQNGAIQIVPKPFDVNLLQLYIGLAKENHFHRLVLDETPNEISVIGTDYKIRYANRERLNRHGFSILGKECYKSFHLEGENRNEPCDKCHCKPILEGKTEKGLFRAREIRDYLGKHYWVDEDARQLMNYNGEILGALNQVRDITVQYHLNNAIIEILKKDRIEDIIKCTVDHLGKAGFKRVRYYIVGNDYLTKQKHSNKSEYFVGIYTNDDYINRNSNIKIVFGQPVYYDDFMAGRIVDFDNPSPIPWDGRLAKSEEQKKLVKYLALQDSVGVICPIIAEQKLIGVISIDNRSREEEWIQKNEKYLKDFSLFLAHRINSAKLTKNWEKLTDFNKSVDTFEGQENYYCELLKQVIKSFKAEVGSLCLPEGDSILKNNCTLFCIDSQEYCQIEHDEKLDINDHIIDFLKHNTGAMNIISINLIKEYFVSNVFKIFRSIGDSIKQKLNPAFLVESSLLALIKLPSDKYGLLFLLNYKNGGMPFPDRFVDLLPQIAKSFENSIVRHEYHKKLEITTQELTKKEESLREFIGMIGHSVRNPVYRVHSILTILKSLIINHRLYPELVIDCNRLIKVTNNLLLHYDYLKEGIKPHRSEFDLIKLIKEVYSERYYYRMKENNIKFNLTYDMEEIIVNWDENLIDIVFENLLANSIVSLLRKKTKVVSEELYVRVTISLENDKVKIEFVDNGDGFNVEDLDTLFSARVSKRTPAGKRQVNTGLGLTNTKVIVNRHGGEIIPKVGSNKEAIFSISIPKN